jgi:hypothetical protein
LPAEARDYFAWQAMASIGDKIQILPEVFGVKKFVIPSHEAYP